MLYPHSMHAYTYIYMCMYIYIEVYVYVYLSIYLSLCIYAHKYVKNINICAVVVFACAFVCIYLIYPNLNSNLYNLT